MLSAIVLLLVAFLLIRLIGSAIRHFVAWLGGGKAIHQMADGSIPVEDAYAEGIRVFVRDVTAWKDEHSGLDRLRSGRPKLTRDQKRAAQRAVDAAHQAYLDVLHLGWYQIVIVFLIGSFLGLLLEEVWMYVTAGLTQSRVGLVWGPFSPLYGFGAVFLTLICWGLRKHHANDLVIFLTSVAVGGGLEQLTGWAMETLIHASSWTYLQLPDHITQWVAWRFLVMWGILGLIWAKAIMPDVLYRIGMPTTKRQAAFVALLAVYLAADIGMTIACFGRMEARKQGISPQSDFDEWVDEHYTDQFIAARFQNLVIGDGS